MSNNNLYPFLKRYDILPNDVGTMQEYPEGAWVKYEDVLALEKIPTFVTLHENYTISRRIKHLEHIIKLYEGEGNEDKGVTKDIGEDDG